MRKSLHHVLKRDFWNTDKQPSTEQNHRYYIWWYGLAFPQFLGSSVTIKHDEATQHARTLKFCKRALKNPWQDYSGRKVSVPTTALGTAPEVKYPPDNAPCALTAATPAPWQGRGQDAGQRQPLPVSAEPAAAAGVGASPPGSAGSTLRRTRPVRGQRAAAGWQPAPGRARLCPRMHWLGTLRGQERDNLAQRRAPGGRPALPFSSPLRGQARDEGPPPVRSLPAPRRERVARPRPTTVPAGHGELHLGGRDAGAEYVKIPHGRHLRKPTASARLLLPRRLLQPEHGTERRGRERGREGGGGAYRPRGATPLPPVARSAVSAESRSAPLRARGMRPPTGAARHERAVTSPRAGVARARSGRGEPDGASEGEHRALRGNAAPQPPRPRSVRGGEVPRRRRAQGTVPRDFAPAPPWSLPPLPLHGNSLSVPSRRLSGESSPYALTNEELPWCLPLGSCTESPAQFGPVPQAVRGISSFRVSACAGPRATAAAAGGSACGPDSKARRGVLLRGRHHKSAGRRTLEVCGQRRGTAGRGAGPVPPGGAAERGRRVLPGRQTGTARWYLLPESHRPLQWRKSRGKRD